jgi:subtilisin family serine protease
MLFKSHINYLISLLLLQTGLLASGSERAAEYLVLLPGGLKKPATADQLSVYFATEHPPQIDYFPESLTAGNDRWALLRSAELTEEGMKQLKLRRRILDFQQNHIYHLDGTAPNDPLYEDQWYHLALGAARIWPEIPAGKEIIVGVIDTGIEYDHPDLVHNIWINRAEDLNQNGILDPADINGLDDDGNGYIDDVVGWDFTDAPRFPDNGDYLGEDNDPSDEYFQGHGTQIAGIIAAEINNNIGIAGLVPGIRIMNLRAGTANGYLEEDDVARAILYAVDNGARIINMSFGDTELSGFLSDVLGLHTVRVRCSSLQPETAGII